MPESSVLQLLLRARSCRPISIPIPALEMSMLLMQIKLNLLPAVCGVSRMSARPGESLAHRFTGNTRSGLQVRTRKAILVKLVVRYGGVRHVILASSLDVGQRAPVARFRQGRTLGGRHRMLTLAKISILIRLAKGGRLAKWASSMCSTPCLGLLFVAARRSS